MTPEKKKAAWLALSAAAKAYTLNTEAVQAQALATAAESWAEAKGWRSAKEPAPGLVFPNYGRSKGQPIAGASVQDLEFYRSGCQRTLEDPAKERWHAKERELLAAIDAELALR